MMVKNLSRKNIEKTNEISSPSIGVLIMHACSREKMKKKIKTFAHLIDAFFASINTLNDT